MRLLMRMASFRSMAILLGWHTTKSLDCEESAARTDLLRRGETDASRPQSVGGRDAVSL